MEHQSNKCNSTGTNRTIGTNGRVECTPTQPEAIRNILTCKIRCISPMEHQSNKCNSVGTYRTIGTNGRVECTPTQPEASGNILSFYNKMHFTNGTPTE